MPARIGEEIGVGGLILVAAATGLLVVFLHERRLRRAAEASLRDIAARPAQEPPPAQAACPPDGLASLAAAFAHEVRNPLNTLSLTFQFLERLVEREGPRLERRADLEKHLQTGASEVEKIKRDVTAFVELAKPRPLELAEVDLAGVLTHAVEVERARRNGQVGAVEFHVEAPPTPLRVDPGQVEDALVAVIDNALDAVTDTTTPRRRIEVTCAPAKGGAEIVVRDSGSGFVGRALDRAFEPFFTTKRDRVGLGLARARSIVEAHGGRVDAANRGNEGGAEVRIELPGAGAARG